MTENRVVGVTMGHPSGIGPEVVIRALCMGGRGWPMIAVYGDTGVMERTARGCGLYTKYKSVIKSGMAGIVDVSSLAEREVCPGAPSEAGSIAQVSYIREAVTRAIDGSISAIATAPISKAGMISCGYNFPGHTELLAKLSGVETVAMMFAGPSLKVSLATTHLPISEVPAAITEDLILKRLRLSNEAVKMFYGINEPRIGVSALNPHGGEEGRLGHEEVRVIAPAIEKARIEGINATGPHPADTLFPRALKKEFDILMVMYHDQAMIPVKTLGFGKFVNLTLGLPFVRTSPDHGTAFDRAPRFTADPTGMANSILVAGRLSAKFRGKDSWNS